MEDGAERRRRHVAFVWEPCRNLPGTLQEPSRRRHAQLQLVGGAAATGAEPPARAFLLRQARAADGGGEGVGRRAAGRLHAHRPPPPRVRRLRRPRGAAPRVRPRKRARGEHHVSEKPVREAASDCSRGVCQSCWMLAGSRLGKRAGRWKGAGVLGGERVKGKGWGVHARRDTIA